MVASISDDANRLDNARGPDLKLFVRDVNDRQGRKRPITVRSWSTVKDIKDALQQVMHVPPSAQHLYFGPLLTSGIELPNYRTLQDAGIYRSGETLLLDIKGGIHQSPFSRSVSLRQSNDVCVSSSMFDATPRLLRNRVEQARRGLAVGYKPEFVLEGSGGTYFLHDARKKKIAVFKPSDEEPYSECNPKNYIQSVDNSLCLREGVKPGEACIREVAAYFLDHEGFSGVPMTTLAEARHPAFNNNGIRNTLAEGGASIGSHSITPNSPVKSPQEKKVGSLQDFVECAYTMDDISPSKLSVEEVHKIAILDIRIMNADRNNANILVQRRKDNTLKLVPIDHGYCLRTVCDVSWMDWCWLDWPQLKEPLSDAHKKYIEDLDIESDANMLHERMNLAQEAIDYFRASSALLKAGVRAGLTLYDIAVLCCRNDNGAEIPSMMEKLFSVASDLAYHAVENERWHHAAASLAIAEQLSPNKQPSKFPETLYDSIRKSASTAALSSMGTKPTKSLLTQALLQQKEDQEHMQQQPSESPNMAQSSASSDSSSESSGAEMEDPVQTWAADLVDPLLSNGLDTRRRRQDSISDDGDSLSASPKGFWVRRPGSFIDSSPFDDGSLAWSPASVSRSVVHPDSAPVLPRAITSRVPVVTFASDSLRSGSFIPPQTVSIGTDQDDSVREQVRPLRRENSLTRSRSFSALPRKTERVVKPGTEAYINYRAYFQKFIDLVIVNQVSRTPRTQRA